MEKIEFTPVDDAKPVSFFVLEETRINGISYLLVTESDENGAEAYILKDTSRDGDPQAQYEFVEEDDELEMVGEIFAELLEDVDIEF
ncbi:MAG: DUF1292 domain-containing protein [Lachnospiraceae bacterium]|nr:DUF1292 domain-containing protein [Lachnospiraceae bacterium]